MKRLAIIVTHPIQYYAPLFRVMTERNKIALKIFYSWGEASIKKHDPGFDRQVQWDIPLLEGYDYEWLCNISPDPGTHHFKGIINPNIIERVSKYSPDAVLVFGWAWHSHLQALRHFHNKIPVYFRGDSTLLDEPRGLKKLAKYAFLKWVYHLISHAFYVGTNNKAYLKKYGLKEQQLTFAPHAIDNERFSLIQTAKACELREHLNLSDEDILILFAGKFEEKKSPLLLLNAFLTLQRRDVHLLFTGNGELEMKMKLIARDNKRVHFIDFQNQSFMPVIYQASDIFCLPSKGPGETWGLAVNEAMACGKPVLLSDKVGCAPDLVKDGVNGYVFRSEDGVDLINKLKLLTASKRELRTLGTHSANMIKDWNFTSIADAIEKRLNNEKKRSY